MSNTALVAVVLRPVGKPPHFLFPAYPSGLMMDYNAFYGAISTAAPSVTSFMQITVNDNLCKSEATDLLRKFEIPPSLYGIHSDL